MAEQRQVILDIQARTGDIEKRLVEVNQGLIQQSESLKELRKAYKNGEITQEQYAQSLTNTQKETKDLRIEQRDLTKQLQLTDKATQAAEGSNEQLRAELSLLTKEYNQLSQEEREATESGQALTKQIRQLSDALKENESAVGDNRRNVGNYAGGIQDALGGLRGIGSAILGPAGAVFALDSLTDAIGQGIEAVIEIDKEFDTLRGNIQRTTGATGEELDNLTARFSATANTFNVETDEIGRAVIRLRDNFGTDLTGAVDLVQQGLLGVADQGAFLSLVSDELSKLVGLGISDESAIAFLVEATNRDINPDILAEPLIALREQTPATVAAIEGAFGPQGAQELFDTFANDPIKGIQAVSNRFAELDGTSAEAGALLADVFKSPGEDAVALAGALGDLNFEIENTVDATNELTQQQQEQLALNEELATAQNELSKELGSTSASLDQAATIVQTFLVKALLVGIQVVRQFIAGIKNTFEILSTFKDIVQNTVGGIGEIFEAVFSGEFSRIPDIIEKSFQDSSDRFKQAGENISQNLAEGFGDAVEEDIQAAEPRVLKSSQRIGRTIGKGVADGIKQEAAQGSVKALEDQVRALEDRLSKTSVDSPFFAGIAEQARLAEVELEAARNKFELLKAGLSEPIVPPDFGQQIDFAEEEAAFFEEGKTEAAQREAERRKQILEQERDSDARIREEIAQENAEEDAQAQERALQTASIIGEAGDLALQALDEDSKARRPIQIAQATADTYVAANAALASGAPPPLNFILAGLTVAAGLRNVAQIAGFATGGLVGEGSQNISPRSNGDNVLATLKVGETVLTRDQMLSLGGPSAMARARVPGYATGGLVGGGAEFAGATQSAQDQVTAQEFQRQIANAPAPIVTVKDISMRENRVTVKDNISSI